jgi:hypothetical protein
MLGCHTSILTECHCFRQAGFRATAAPGKAVVMNTHKLTHGPTFRGNYKSPLLKTAYTNDRLPLCKKARCQSTMTEIMQMLMEKMRIQFKGLLH